PCLTAEVGGGQGLVHATPAADDDRAIGWAFAGDGSPPELERVVASVQYGRWCAHHTDIHEGAVALHAPAHEGEHLLGARDVHDLEVGHDVEDRVVVVGHVRGAVRACLEVGGCRQHHEIEAVTLAEPAVGCGDRLEP